VGCLLLNSAIGICRSRCCATTSSWFNAHPLPPAALDARMRSEIERRAGVIAEAGIGKQRAGRADESAEAVSMRPLRSRRAAEHDETDFG
jgi:hypothetical protein